MEEFNPYIAVIVISIIIIISYFFNIISEKTSIPSVLLLIVTGILIKLGLTYFHVSTADILFNILELLGIVGLIMIVLEASLDLHLTREKWPLIWKSLTVALLSLLSCSLVIAWLLQEFLINEFTTALAYAIPLSVISSAIVLPSVGGLEEAKQEFLVYESTFSDILGIMYFYFVVGNIDSKNVNAVVWDVFSNIFITLLLSVVISYGLVLIFQRVKTNIKLFLLIAVLLLLYSLGKLFHLSSLFIILIFGLVLNNHKLFFRGLLKKWINSSSVHAVLRNFHLITIETAFVIRTFFFVIFGMTIDLSSLTELSVLWASLIIVVSLFAIRALFLLIFKGKNSLPELFIAPRGLITILLFFAIPAELAIENFNTGILFYTILITSVVMAIALIAKGKHLEPAEAVSTAYWEEVDKEIDSIPADDKNKTLEEKISDNGDKNSTS